jgi:proline iminopeptidase
MAHVPKPNPPRHPASQAGMLQVSRLHTLYWEEFGSADGLPVLALDGWLGAVPSRRPRSGYDPGFFRTIRFDPRGSHRSTPTGELWDNTIHDVIEDIERLRKLRGIGQWIIIGTSWSTALALAYAQAYPQACLGFVLQGMFLGTATEIDWVINGMGWFHPKARDDFTGWIAKIDQDKVLKAYESELFSSNTADAVSAAQHWMRYVTACSLAVPDPQLFEDISNDPTATLAAARLHVHYLLHQMFLAEGELLQNVSRITHTPAILVQGDQDVLCPVAAAYDLQKSWPAAELRIVNGAAHSTTEHAMHNAILQAMTDLRIAVCNNEPLHR